MKNWRFWVGVAISALFIGVSLHQVKDWHAFLNSFRQVKLWVLIPTILTYTLVMLSRGWRWYYIMNSQLKVRYSSSLSGLIIGYMGNNILPFRAGELIRAVVVAKREKQSFTPVFASVVVERIFDGLAVLVFLAVILIWLKFPAEHQMLKETLRKGGIGALVGAIGLMVFLYALYLSREPVVKLAGKILKPFGSKAEEFGVRELDKFSRGLIILGKPSRMVVVMLQSFLVWLVNLLPIYFVGLGFGAHFSFMGLLLLLFLGAFSAAIPAAPGFWGTFHFITSRGIIFLGALPPEAALSMATVIHAFYYFPTLLIGLLLLWLQGYSIFELEHEAEAAEHKPPAQ